MKQNCNYSNIYLTPNYSEHFTRNASLKISFLGKEFETPWLPANMESVGNPDICKWLSENGHFYIYQRFGNTFEFVKTRESEQLENN